MRPASLRFVLHRGSIRERLMLWNACVLALILAFLGATIQYLVQTNLQNSVDQELARRAAGMRLPPPFFPHPPPGEFGPGETGGPMLDIGPLAGHHGPPRQWMPGGPPPVPDRGQRLIERSEDPYRPRMFNLQGQSMQPGSSQRPWDLRTFRLAVQGEQKYATLIIDNEPVRIISRPLRHQGKVVAVTQFAYPLTEVNRAISGMNRVLLAMIPVALLLAALGGAMLTDRALRPVRDIVQTADRIGAQELSERLPVVGGDEFSHLAMTFNGMLARLEVAFLQQKSLVRQLEQLIEQERRFTADASHELKTPLTIIKANTSFMLQTNPTQADYREMVEEVDRAADTMSHLVQDLLLLARFDEGQLGRDLCNLPVRGVLAEAQRRIRNPNAIPITLEVAADTPDLCGNRDEIVRLFSNLLENAARYTPAGGEIRVSAQTEGDYVLICVADTGIGIAPEHLPHLGERFYRVDTARSHNDGGTGLGLSICKSIVEAHHGTLSIQSMVGKGTTVSVKLPPA